MADSAGAAVHDDQEEILRRMRLAANYNAWLFDRARPYLGRRVLDAGAGSGTFTAPAAEMADLVVAAEPDPLFADMLRRQFAGRDDVVVLEAGGEDLRPEALPAPVDSVICFNVLEHIRDDERALESMRGVLAPDGALLLLVPAHRALFGETDRAVGHERRYTVASLRARLDRAGFAVEDIRYVNPLGALGWLVSSRILKRRLVPERSLRIYDVAVPALRTLDRFRLPFGLSVWAVARAGRPS